MCVVRVVAGTARGRKLVAPDGRDVRPTTDRVREATANALASMGAIEGARVVDLFAGSGALGIEALSRGALEAVFVDPDRAARAAIGANLVTTGFDGPATRIVASSAQQYLRSCGDATCGLAFADPPYAFDDWPGLFADLDPVMAHDGVIVVESDRSIVGSPGWNVTRSRRYGSTVVEIHVRAAAPPSLHGVNQ